MLMCISAIAYLYWSVWQTNSATLFYTKTLVFMSMIKNDKKLLGQISSVLK